MAAVRDETVEYEKVEWNQKCLDDGEEGEKKVFVGR